MEYVSENCYDHSPASARSYADTVGILIIVICASAFVLLLSAMLTFHVIILYMYGAAVADLYFSKNLAEQLAEDKK